MFLLPHLSYIRQHIAVGVRSMAFSSSSHLLLLHLLAVFFFCLCYSQQPYIDNVQLDCYAANSSSALGYSCNGVSSSCDSFLTFRATSPYLSPALIAFLLSADATNISRLNAVTDVNPLPADDLVIIPVSCSCSNRFYQYNASYTLKTPSETYFTVANDTFEGLSTCQALMDQNPFDSRNLSVGYKLVVPLRCACPTLNQTRVGVKYLLSYLIASGDDIPTIAQTFRADYQSVLAANEINAKSTIYPYTTLVIPLSTAPTALFSPPPPAPKASDVPPPPSGSGGSSHTGVFVGVGTGVGLVLILGVLALYFCFWRRPPASPINRSKLAEQGSSLMKYGDQPIKTTSSAQAIPSPFASGMRGVLDWITLYKFDELQRATGYFDEEHRIRGSVYRGVINGDAAAIKQLNGDVSSEINVLKLINHSSLIRLSGFCLHEGNTYIVFEYAELGSLSDWLHRKKSVGDTSGLNWKQRIQIACNVADGLNYLHSYTNPPYIHKNLTSSNVLIGRDFRAKISNFGLARPVVEEEGLQQVTRHVIGTQGYLAPEYLDHGLITPKIDVFAFGVVLLELLSGKEAIFAREGEEKGEVLLSSVIEDILCGGDVRSKLSAFLDPSLRNDYPFDLAFATAELAKRCVSRDHASRPTMNELLVSLSAIYNSTHDWNPEHEITSTSASAIHGR